MQALLDILVSKVPAKVYQPKGFKQKTQKEKSILSKTEIYHRIKYLLFLCLTEKIVFVLM